MTQEKTGDAAGGGGLLEQLSDQIAGVVSRAGMSVVRVDDDSRLTASGIVWPLDAGADAIIVATSHGVEDDEHLFVVEPASGARLAATVVGRDAESDIAVLRVAGASGQLIAAALAPAGSVTVGQLALALGRPGESSLSATLGNVSARHDAVENGRSESIVHTDATLYPGFSGGALVDARGRVIGLLNLAFRRTGGIALGADMVSNIAEALLASGSLKRGYLGVGTQTVELSESQVQAVSSPSGLLVVHVEKNSPADRSGLIVGDILLTLADQPLEGRRTLRSLLRRMPPGSAARIVLLRGGTVTQMEVILGEEE